MHRDRLGLVARLIVVAIVALLSVGCSVNRDNSVNPAPAVVAPPSSAQQIDIYTPVINDALVRSQVQSRFAGGRKLYLVDTTGEAFGDPLLDRQQPAKREKLTKEVRAGLEHAIQLGDVDVVWIESFDKATDETTGLVSDGVAIALGPIDFVSSDQARVPVTLYLGNLAASGWTSMVKLVGDAWSVIGTTGTEWTS